MDAAVSAKNYAEAEHFRVRLTELAEEKALAIEKEQHSNNPSSPMDPVAKVRRVPLFCWLIGSARMIFVDQTGLIAALLV